MAQMSHSRFLSHAIETGEVSQNIDFLSHAKMEEHCIFDVLVYYNELRRHNEQRKMYNIYKRMDSGLSGESIISFKMVVVQRSRAKSSGAVHTESRNAQSFILLPN